mgnify:CR=1 FL=1|tara:strand:- start:113 stop:1282 length:1170 start_codon:yes stop_codon:yes gene_type:complete
MLSKAVIRLGNHLDWRVPMVFSFLIGVIVFGWLYWKYCDGNITGFFRIGSEFSLSPFLNPDKVLTFKGEIGYDGQQFLSIALDPGLANESTILSLDNPAYRYRRILYPLLGYLFGGGNPLWIPWALVGINVIALSICTGLIALILSQQRRSVYQAMWFLSIPGIWMVLSHSTCDLLASTWGLGAIISAQNRRISLMVICLTAGLLTRETLFILWLALLLVHLKEKRIRVIAALGVSTLPILTWLGYIHYRNLPGNPGIGNLDFPFAGIAEKFQVLITSGITGINLYEILLWCSLWFSFGWLLWLTRQPSAFPNSSDQILWNTLHYTGLAYLGLFLVSAYIIHCYYINYSRIFLDVFIYGGLIIKLPRFWNLGLLSCYTFASLAFIFLHS